MDASLMAEYDSLVESLLRKIPVSHDRNIWTMRQILEVMSEKQKPNQITIRQVVEDLRALDQAFDVDKVDACLEKLRDIRQLTVPMTGTQQDD